jgi:hypothetical protein
VVDTVVVGAVMVDAVVIDAVVQSRSEIIPALPPPAEPARFPDAPKATSA